MVHAAACALMGAFALAAQTALFREYLVVYEGNELGIAFFFSSWLFFVGVGALAGRRFEKAREPGRAFPDVLAVYGPALLLQLLLIRSLRSLAGVAPTDLFPAAKLFAATFLSNAPVSLVTGALFPLASAAAKSTRGAVGRVYVLECLGSAVGAGALTTFLLAGSGALPVLPVACVALSAVGLPLALRSRARFGAVVHSLVLTASLVLLLTPAGPALTGRLDDLRFMDLQPHAKRVASIETPYRRIDVAERAGQKYFLANGGFLFAWPPGDAGLAEAALLRSQLEVERPPIALVIGDGTAPLALELLRSGFAGLTLHTTDPAGLDFILGELPAEMVEVLLPAPSTRSPGTVVSSDLGDAGRPGGLFDRWDLIVVDAGDPDTAAAARYFTAEFDAWARDHLTGTGVLAKAISSAENWFGTEVTRYGASVLATMETAFPRVLVTPGERSWFLASRDPERVSLDPEVVAERYRKVAPKGARYEPERFSTWLEPRRVAFAEEVYRGLPDEERRGLVSTDERPLAHLLNLLVLLRRQGGRLSETILAIGRAGFWPFLLPLLAFLLVRFRYAASRPDRAASRRFSAGWLLFVVGGAGIALHIGLLLAYQQRYGLLFQKIGIANAIFMVGLFLGGAAGTAIRRPSEVAAAVAGAAAAAIAFALPLAVRAVVDANVEAAFLLLFLTAGAACGAPFTIAAALLGGERPGLAGALLASADHLGGALGALVTGALVVPLLGVAGAMRLTGLVLLSAPLLFSLEAAARSAGLPSRWARRLESRLTTYPFVRTAHVLLAVTLAAVLASYPVRRELDRPLIRIDPERLRGVVAADRFLEVEEPFLHYDAWREGEAEPANHTLASRAATEGVEGFGGPLNLLLSVDLDGTLHKASVLEWEETPAYVREIPGWLADVAGKDLAEPFRLVKEGEAERANDLVKITGASVTCRAVVGTLNRARERILPGLFGREVGGSASYPVEFGAEGIALIALFLAAVPVFLFAGGRVRTGFLLVVLVVLGLVHNQQLAAGRVESLLALELPPLANLPGLFLVAGALALAVLFGPVYCGLLCPFGAAQELLGKLGLLRRVSPEVDRRARFVKHAVLAVVTVAALGFGSKRILDFDPLAVAFSFKGEVAVWILIGGILALSLFYFRFWCRYLCPVGALLSLSNRIALLARFVRKKDYRRCDLGVRSKLDMDCLHCNRCITAGGDER